MYDELVKRLRADSDYMDNNGIMLYAAAPFYRECADAIEELSKRADEWETIAEGWQKACKGLESRMPRWIPVTERLPEFDQKVLAWVKNKDPEGRFNKDGIYTAELKDKMPKPDPEGKRNFWGIPGYDSVWTVWSWSYFTEPDVLFWMPLPEPPMEEET